MNKLDIITLTETLNGIYGAIRLANERAATEVKNIINKSKNKCFTFTRHEDESYDFTAEIVFGDFKNTVRVLNAHFKGRTLYLDCEDGYEWLPYEVGISMPDLLNAMIEEVKYRED